MQKATHVENPDSIGAFPTKNPPLGNPVCGGGRDRSERGGLAQKPTNILALFARGREIGFVWLEGGSLYRYGVKTIKGKRRGPAFYKQIGKSLKGLLEKLGPDGMVVIERVNDGGRQGGLAKALPRIVEQFVDNVYPLMSLSLSEVKQSLCGSPEATHIKLMETIAQREQIFLSLLKDGKAQKRNYWKKVLMAMALGEVGGGEGDKDSRG